MTDKNRLPKDSLICLGKEALAATLCNTRLAFTDGMNLTACVRVQNKTKQHRLMLNLNALFSL